ncbi:MAG: hypothetical protein A4E65_01209 [Syntrophorhabdus sp. PtaU1.Bin153]|nr:MAG: hypothetical protein A4E65_01209 [Syntrophorhabdus sp. PtaU1.Bin153]
MRKTKTLILNVIFLALFVGFGGAAQGQNENRAKEPDEKPGVIMIEAVSGVLVVDAVDPAKRTVSLKSDDGKIQTYKLGPEVRNFDQIKVGDVVNVTLFESVAVFVRKSDENPAAREVQTVRMAPKGTKPGVVVSDTTEVTAKVEALDYAKRTVTLKGPAGNMRTISVDEGVKRFDNIKVGDEVVLRITDAMAIAVEKP